MTCRHAPPRRALLRGGLAAAMALASATAWTVGGARSDANALACRMTALFTTPSSAARIGRHYLHGRTGATMSELLVEIAGSWRALARLEAMEDAALHAELARTVHADFVAQRTVRVEGWVLACTEARLMALVAATHTTSRG